MLGLSANLNYYLFNGNVDLSFQMLPDTMVGHGLSYGKHSS